MNRYTIFIFFICTIAIFSQNDTLRYYKKSGLYPEGNLQVSSFTGITKYLGEYTDNKVGWIAGLQTKYFFPYLPELSLTARFSHGRLKYERRFKPNFAFDFDRQFPPEDYPDARSKALSRQTKITSFDGGIILNLLARRKLNYYLYLGYGVLSFQPDDIEQDARDVVDVPIHYPDYKVEDEFDYHILGGLGIEYYPSSKISLGVQAVYNMLHTDELDGYAQLGPNKTPTTFDSYVEFGLKLSYHFFGDNDKDNDGLSNIDEEKYKTNPYKKDSDDDGVSDYDEVNIFISNPLISDTDNDGLKDGEEIKINTSITSSDTDKDGINDLEELTLYKSNPLNIDGDNDGLADKKEFEFGSDPMNGDTDGDGVKDGEDKCPAKFGSIKNSGCPFENTIRDTVILKDTVYSVGVIDTVYIFQERKPIKVGQTYKPYGINFKTNSAEIEVESELILDDIAKWLKENSSIRLEIQGHTDSDGTDNDNYILSEKRAQSVKNYLVLQGIKIDRLVIKGFGESKPVDPANTDKAKARNRRIEFLVVDN